MTDTRSDRSGGQRITRVRTRVVRVERRDAQWNPRTRWKEKVIVLVGVETDGGVIGIGEAFCDGGSPASVVALIEEDFAQHLLGETPGFRGRIHRAIRERNVVSAKGGAVFAALSGIDIALWDLEGKLLGVPVSRLLGACTDRVPAYASAGLYGAGKDAAALGREMAGYVARGFRAVKIKVGGAPLREDIARVAAVREAIGPDIRLMIDALYACSVPDAKRLARAVERYDIHFLEAPVHPADLAGLGRVSAASPVPVAGNEYAYGLDGFRDVIDRGGVDVVHLDAVLCGGITEAVRIAALADAAHRPVSYHAASSAVCLAANLQAGAAAPNCESIEFHMYHQILFDRLPEPAFNVEDGCVVLPDAPGLGLALDFDAL